MNNQTCIMITKGKFNDKKKTLDDGLYKIEWEGQKTRDIYDNHIDKGTHVFWRKNNSIPFTYLGKVINRTLIKERTETNPIKLNLIVADYDCDYKNFVCNICD